MTSMYRIQDFFIFHGRTVVISLIALLVAAAALWFGARPLLAGPHDSIGGDPTVNARCTVLAIDVGDSTGVAGAPEVRQRYAEIAQDAIEPVVANRGTVITGFFAGDASEVSPRPWNFDVDAANSLDRRQQTSDLRNELNAVLQENLEVRRPATNGSAILATIKRLADRTEEHCAITVATDGLENSALADFGTGGRTPLVGDGATDRLIDSLTAQGMIPNLAGRRLTMPAIGEVAAGLPGNAQTIRREIDPRRREMVSTFWQAYARAAGTDLHDRVSGGH